MPQKISAVLVANRGEIAVRIIRACRELGIRTIAVYSEPDRTAPHAISADEAYLIGPAASSESYLVQEKIIETALQTGADAIHPGYGFLSENPTFARAVKSAGLIFIGPSAEAIESMGDKTSARTLMIEKGVPVVPGTEEAVTSIENAAIIAEQVGYPVLIKAAAGGGGKGMRAVEKPEDLERGMAASQNEARMAFGDDRVYIEKFIINPRHIEIQILADNHGNVIHLGERECSIQRRHQKVVEECPSSAVNEDLRKRMGASAVLAAKSCSYTGAGTIEFLLDSTGDFYFLEMNTRLQVEHPVTEMVTGIDLVKMQIRIAEGESLGIAQDDVKMRGHAIESRLCAEDVVNNFLPSTGIISEYRPSQGFGVREDSGIRQGSEISIYYDPMFAKLIAWAEDRESAIDVMKRALNDYRISGVSTTIPFCLYVMEHPSFVSGDFNIGFVQQHYDASSITGLPDDVSMAAAVAAVLFEDEARVATQQTNTNGSGSMWNVRSRTRA
jgi:acetyl-CoA carboxylase, biotin carboxylase subunit